MRMALFTSNMEPVGVVDVSARIIAQIRDRGRFSLLVLEPLPFLPPEASVKAVPMAESIDLWFEWIGDKALLVMSKGPHERLLFEGLRPFVSGEMPSPKALYCAENFVRTLRY